LDQEETPFYTGVRRYVEQQVIPFHTPGHKQGGWFDSDLLGFAGRRWLEMDVSDAVEDETCGNDHRCLLYRSERLAAMAFGADRTFFLVNGTTGGIHASLLATVRPGERVLVPRDAHKSVFNALVLTGAKPVYLNPVFDRHFAIPTGFYRDFHSLLSANDREPARALILTRPNYYGVTPEISGLIRAAHKRDLVVIVDEAHAAHFQFCDRLPDPALRAGADIVVQSTHKWLTALTQASMLHLRGHRVKQVAVEAALNIIQTTSPSHLLLSSLDVARRQMWKQGRLVWDRYWQRLLRLREDIDRLPGLECLCDRDLEYLPGVCIDKTKIVVRTWGAGWTGVEAAGWLRRRFKIAAEMADIFNLVLFITPGDGPERLQLLLRGLRALTEERPPAADPGEREAVVACLNGFLDLIEGEDGRPVLDPRQAFFARGEQVPLSSAAGYVAGGSVCLYPPGVPLVLPGEVVKQPVADLVQRALLLGLGVDGLSGTREAPLITIVRAPGV